MKAPSSFETSGTNYPVTRRHIAEERSQRHRRENLKTSIFFFLPFLYLSPYLHFFFVLVSFHLPHPSLLAVVILRICSSVFRDAAGAARLDPRAAA